MLRVWTLSLGRIWLTSPYDGASAGLDYRHNTTVYRYKRPQYSRLEVVLADEVAQYRDRAP